MHINHNKSTALERSVKLSGGGGYLNRFYAKNTLALGSALVKKTYKVFGQSYKSRSNNTELKQDETSTARPLLKRWSNRYPTVEPQWARPYTEHRALTSCIEHV